MYAALNEAQKAFDENEVPVGAVIVHKNIIIGRGRNQVECLNDATAHAEIIAITSSSNHLKNKFLHECDLYVTAEPCVMCAGAILLSRIENVYIGTNEPKFGACGSMYNILDDEKYNHSPNVFTGLLEKEASKLMEDFFSSKRKSSG